jgi:hypothetical protein
MIKLGLISAATYGTSYRGKDVPHAGIVPRHGVRLDVQRV